MNHNKLTIKKINIMKTKAFTILAIAALAFGTVNFSNAATVNTNKEVSTTLTSVSKINNIEVRGNVEVFVSDGTADQVKVYNRYYAENAVVQNVNGTLRISSYKAEKLVVWVTAKDLRGITAYDNSEVKSFGKLNEIGLDVALYDNASAKLDLDAYSANISVNDRAKADLTGNVSQCDLKYTNITTVNQSQLVAEHLTKTVKVIKARKTQTDELAEL
jgi:hypothetical protein